MYYSSDVSHIVPLSLEDYENGYACDSLQSSTYFLCSKVMSIYNIKSDI